MYSLNTRKMRVTLFWCTFFPNRGHIFSFDRRSSLKKKKKKIAASKVKFRDFNVTLLEFEKKLIQRASRVENFYLKKQKKRGENASYEKLVLKVTLELISDSSFFLILFLVEGRVGG